MLHKNYGAILDFTLNKNYSFCSLWSLDSIDRYYRIDSRNKYLITDKSTENSSQTKHEYNRNTNKNNYKLLYLKLKNFIYYCYTL